MSFLEKKKEFELLRDKYDPYYDKMREAMPMIKQFIIDNSLVLYGGCGIDFALRRFNDKIYPDDSLAVPDLDFYSPEHVKHSYELARALYDLGHTSARAIVAEFTHVMKVDVGDNHWIADISYKPPAVYQLIPTLTYEQMKIVHPLYQRIDSHSSLSFPYDNPPREVIFDRWKKDIERFNLLAKYYTTPAAEAKLVNLSSGIQKKYVLAGFAAYSAIYQDFVGRIGKTSGAAVKGLLWAQFTIKRLPDSLRISYSGVEDCCDFVHFNPEKMARELSAGATPAKGAAEVPYTHYEPFGTFLPERYEVSQGDDHYRVFSTRDQLVTVNTIVIGENIRVVNIQYLLKQMLGEFFLHRDTTDPPESKPQALGAKSPRGGFYKSPAANSTPIKALGGARESPAAKKKPEDLPGPPKLAADSPRTPRPAVEIPGVSTRVYPDSESPYLHAYNSLMSMIATATALNFDESTVYFPQVTTYGFDNVNIAKKVALNRLYHDVRGDDLHVIPRNYYPATSAKHNLNFPSFDPDSVEFFRESGRVIPPEKTEVGPSDTNVPG
jgi:hypothetical protein